MMYNNEDAKLSHWPGGGGTGGESESHCLLETRRHGNMDDYLSNPLDHHHHHHHHHEYIPRTVTIVNRPPQHYYRPFPAPTTSTNPPAVVANKAEKKSLVSKFVHEIKTHWRLEMCSSLVLLIILLCATHMHQVQDWTLIIGETRIIQQQRSFFFLTHAAMITVSSQPTTTSATLGDDDHAPSFLRVYDIPGGTCPPLNGPIVNIDDRYTMTLKKNHYQYDYFYLNVGSTIHVKVSQRNNMNARSSSANVFLFQGKDKLDRLQNTDDMDNDYDDDDDDDDDDLGRDALVTKFISRAGRGVPSSTTIDHVVETKDVYMVVYDNASSKQKVDLVVDYHIDQTSYDLSQHTPTCHPGQRVGKQECSLNISSSSRRRDSGNKRCILVESLGYNGHGPKKDSYDNNNSNSLEKEGLVVHVNVTGQREWMMLFFCAFAPPILYGLLIGKKCGSRRRRSSNKNSSNIITNPVAAGVYNDNVDVDTASTTYYTNPPSTSPQYTPTECNSIDNINININNSFLDESNTIPLQTPLPQPIPPTAFLAQAQEVLVDQGDDDDDFGYSSIPIVWAENVVPIPSPSSFDETIVKTNCQVQK